MKNFNAAKFLDKTMSRESNKDMFELAVASQERLKKPHPVTVFLGQVSMAENLEAEDKRLLEFEALTEGLGGLKADLGL